MKIQIFCLMFVLVLLQSVLAQDFSVHFPDHHNGLHQLSQATAFEENKGQVRDQFGNPRPDVLFSGMAGGLVYHMRASGISYQLTRFEEGEEPPAQNRSSGPAPGNDALPGQELTIYRVDVNWLNMLNSTEVVMGEALSGYNNYYNVPAGIEPVLHVRSFDEVTFRNVWDGIDLRYYIRDGILESDWLVERAENYHRIVFEVQGAELSIDAEGYLLMQTPLGVIREGQLAVYQGGKRLPSAWRLEGNRVSFEIEGYIYDQPLVIDPPVRLWGTYYGGNYSDVGYSVDVDAGGNVYLTGETLSTMNIATTGAHQTIHGNPSSMDMFLVKFNPSGVLQWSTYYGGSGADIGFCVCVDMTVESGDVYVAGWTFSTNNMATPGAHEDSMRLHNGNNQGAAFLVKFNPGGLRQWGTYYGSPFGLGQSCAVDKFGDVYLAGSWADGDVATEGAHQATPGGAFLAKFTPSGVRLWGTYYGLDASGWSCAVDASGNVFLAGETKTHHNALPNIIATPGAHQTTYAGFGDCFLVKFNTNGVRQWGTYYGGVNDDYSPSISIDGAGNVYLSAYTKSTNNIASPGSHRDIYIGPQAESFLVKFDSTGARQWSTYFGNINMYLSGYLQSSCLANNQGDVFLSGTTTADTGIATPGAYMGTAYYIYSGNGYIAKFDHNGNRIWGTYVPGRCNSTAADAFGNFYLTGSAGNVPMIAPSGAHQTTCPGSSCAWLLKFTECDNYLIISGQPQNQYVSAGHDALFTLTVSNASAQYQWQTDTGNGFFDLVDTGQYVGTSTNTLQVLNVHTGNTNQPFRCVVTAPPCSDTSHVAVLMVTTGLAEPQNKGIFSIYPNPASEQITIRQTADTHGASWALSDLTGRTITSGKISSQKTLIKINHLSPGICFLTIHNPESNTREIFKVVVR